MLFLCQRQIQTMKSCLQFLKNLLTAKLAVLFLLFFCFACSLTSFHKCTESCNYDHNQHAEPSSLRPSPFLVKAPESIHGLFSMPTVSPVLGCHVNGTAQ